MVSDSGLNFRGFEDIPSDFTRFACFDHELATFLTTVVNKMSTTTNAVKSPPFYRCKGTPGIDAVLEMND